MSKLRMISFKSLDLLIIFMMIFGPSVPALAAPALPAVTIPGSFFTVTDQQGSNDVPGQVDMTQMGRDDSDSTMFKLFWSWDAVDFTSQTGDACALFDYNGNGNVDAVVCGQIQNAPNVWSAQNPVIWQTTDVPNSFPNGWTTGGSPFVFRCDDSNNDRCGQPSAPQPYSRYTDVIPGTLGTLDISPTANLVTDTDPFFSDPVPPDSGQGEAYPYDSTLQINITKAYLQTLAANLGNKYPAIQNPTPTLVNVCSYPSAGNGGNNNPFDCIVTPGGGFLKISKDAGSDTTTQFNFTVNPGSISKSVTGTGTTGAFPMPVGTAYSVAETLVTGWDLTDAACKLEDGTTATGSWSSNTISSITVQSGKITTCTFTNVKQNPKLTLDKTASPMTYSAVGTVISYSYLVTNSGNVKLAGPVTVTDDKATVTCPNVNTVGNLDNFLDPNESVTCTASYTIQQADINSGSVTNTATANAGGTNSNQDSETVNATQTKSLLLDKTATPATYAKVGDVISYSYLVTNNGNVSLAGPVTVVDNKATVTCPAVTTVGNLDNFLDPGESVTCTASYTISQADLDAGSVTNTAKASASGTDSNQDSETVNAAQNPHLSITKNASPATYTKVGDVITYTIVATNDGNVTLKGVTVSDPNVTGLTCDPANGSNLAPNTSMTCTGTHTVVQADLDAGHYANSACVDDGAGGAAEACASKDVPGEQNPHLTITKKADLATYSKVGDVITYTIVATNDGNVTLKGVTVSDPNVSGLTCNPANGSDLAPGAFMTCTGTHTITQGDLDAGHYANTACVDDGAGGAAEACASNDVPGTQNPHLTITKSADPATYSKVGDIINYIIVATNDGNVTLHNVTVSDPSISGLTCNPANGSDLAPNASMTCTGTYTITQVDLDAGHHANTACVDDGAGGATQACASKDVPGTQNPHLSITKSAAPSTYSTVGELITYTIVATNDGNVTLHNVTVTDPNVSGLTCNPANGSDLAPGASMTCSGTHTIVQADLDAGHFANTSCVDDGMGGAAEACASKDVPGDQTPHLTLLKTSVFNDENQDGYAQVGETISYSFAVTNDGNVTLYNITITDPKVIVTGGPLASLAVGVTDSTTFTGSYKLTQADIDAGKVDNTALAAGKGPQDQPVSDEDDNTQSLPQNPAIQLLKSATLQVGNNGTLEAGDTVLYGFVITNIGNVTLAGVDLDDSLLGYTDATCGATTLAPGASTNCTATYILTQADLDAGSVANIGNACGTPPSGPDVCDTDGTNTSLAQNPALTIAKTAAPTTYDAAGDVISYSYKVENTGNVTISGPFTVFDDKATDEACPSIPASLKPGEFTTCTASYTILQSDMDSGSVTNAAYATGSFNGNEVKSNTDTETVTAIQSPAIDLVKTVTSSGPYDSVGDLITYKLVTTNIGNVTLSNVSISDPLLGALTCVQPVTLAPTETLTCTGSYAVQQTDLDAGKVGNTATTTGSFGGKDYTDTDSQSVPMTQSPAISLAKTASPTTYNAVDQTITYSYVITNIGNVTLPGPFTVSDDKATVTCDAAPVGGLAPLATLNCAATYKITQGDLDVGAVKNTATASTTYNGNEVTSAPADATVTADQNPALTLDKTASPITYSSVGQTISYSYKLTNSGNVTLSGPFTVIDDKATVTCPATSTLAPSAYITCSASYTITQNDLDNGSVKNTAKGKGSFNSKDVFSNEDSETVTANQTPAITLTKSASPTLYSKAGDVITYTLVAKNSGNVTLHDVSITDPKLGTLTCTPSQPAILAPNDTMTCTGTYTIQAADLTVFSVTNTATVNGKGPQDQPISATATATVYRQTGALLPTQTTCQQYASGSWPAMYDAFTYQVKSNKINSVAPGVIFYYNTITAPSASFTLTVVETNTLNWKPMLIQDLGQAILYDANCNKTSGVTVTTTNNPYTVKFTVTGATPGAIYYIGIKYSPQNLIGQPVKQPYPTSIYSWNTTGYTGSKASIPVKYKK